MTRGFTVLKTEEEDEEGVTPVFYGCKVVGHSTFRNPDFSNLQLLTVKENNKVDDLFNFIKENGGIADKPGEKDGIQILKLLEIFLIRVKYLNILKIQENLLQKMLKKMIQ